MNTNKYMKMQKGEEMRKENLATEIICDCKNAMKSNYHHLETLEEKTIELLDLIQNQKSHLDYLLKEENYSRSDKD